MTTAHNHGNDFGRYHADCPRCIQKYPDGKIPPRPPRKMRAPNVVMNEKIAAMKAELREEMRREMDAGKPRPEPQPDLPPPPAPGEEKTPVTLPGNGGISLSVADLMAVLEAQARTLGYELRKPDPEVQAEKDAQKRRNLAAKESERKVVMEALAIKRQVQANCEAMGHRQNEGRGDSAISGQAHSDGFVHNICVVCQKEFPPRPVRPQEMSMGVS